MSNIEITNNETNGVVIWDPTFRPETFNSTGAATFAAGTVLGRLTANGKLSPYASGNADGSEIPVAVLTYEVVFTGAGDQPIRALVSGQVREDDMIEHGVGVITNVAVFDQLRDYGIVALPTSQLSELDNL